MTTRVDHDRHGLLAPAADDVRRGWAALGAVLLVALVHLAPATGLTPGSLDADLGIQYFLGGETARGAVPLIDFEHTWNVGSWWFNAALHRIVDGDPSAWLYLWGRVLGPALAAVTAVGVLYRLRLRAEWILIGAGSWLALSHVIHSKYTIPVVWVLVLLPTGRRVGLRRAVVARMVLAGLTMLSQVELAVLLGAGVMLFDLIGTDRPGGTPTTPVRARIARAAAVPAGAALALGLELVVYASLGQPPQDILRQLLFNAAETAPGFNYGYPVFEAVSLRPKLFPASLLLGFIPIVWQRVSAPTRLVACLHLSQALVAIRRPDAAHVDAATTLLGLLVVLVAHDLVVGRRGADGAGATNLLRPSTWGSTPATSLLGVGLGLGVMAVATTAAFRTESLLALALPTAVLAVTVVVVPRLGAVRTAFSAGAVLAVVGLLVASTAGGILTSLRSGQALASTQQLAVELAEPLDDCTDGRRTAWIVPGPLPLYTEMGITNPTPYAVFWYGFTAEHDRVRAAIDDGAIPAVVQVGDAWPESFGTLPDDIARSFSVCATLDATPIGQPVRIWVAD